MIRSRNSKHWSMMYAPLLCLSLLAGIWQLAGAQDQGYEATNNGITVYLLEHWQNWDIPTHAVDLIPEGGVKPHLFRQRYNVLDDLKTFKRKIEPVVIKKDQKAIRNVVRSIQRRRGVMRLDEPKMGKYLDANFQRFPGSETFVVFNDQLFTITDTTMTDEKNGTLALRNVDTGRTSIRKFNTNDKEQVPIFDYFVQPGISRVGSNPDSAANILDGDPATTWEPDPNDPIENWWIEVDLGRTVPVDELFLRFADEATGDPFRQFKVLTAPSQEVLLQDASDLDFAPVAGTKRPNVDQRVFSYSMEDDLDAAPGWTGRMIETIRIVVFDTKGARHTRIEEDEWEALDPEDRGDIVYFVKDLGGFEEPLFHANPDSLYEELKKEDRHGRKDYYRRERPRLAEVEAFGWGDNISPGIDAGGGSFDLKGDAFSPPIWAFDGDYGTWFLQTLRTPTLVDRGVLTADLGATFWLDELRISAINIMGQAQYFDGYIHRGSDGSRDARGNLRWIRLSPPEREDNMVTQYYQILDQYSPAPRVRFLETRIVTTGDLLKRNRGGAGIVEYQLYTRDYPAEVALESGLIELPVARNFGRISWEADTPSGTRLEVRTRSGDLLNRVIRFFDKSGKEITESAWGKLLKSFRGPVDTTFVPAAGWSPWSRIYKESGEWVTSPGLRKFAQVHVKLITEDRQVAASIRSLDLELVQAAGERILAELWPAQVVAPGLLDTFEVFIQPNFIENPAPARSLGFDEILLEMAVGRSMELLEVGLGVDPETGQAGRVFTPAGGVFADQDGEELGILRNKADSIWVRLPEPLNILPEADRLYHRITAEGEQVPVDQEGLLLTAAAYGLLDEVEKGDVQYFRRNDNNQLIEVNQVTYEGLKEAEAGPVRYFRILQGDGAQFPFDTDGDTLSSSAYNRLPSTQKGAVIGPGQLVGLRFKASVFRNGTTLRLGVRNTRGGADAEAPWQIIDPGDATPMIEANTLSIGVPFESSVLDDFAIAPNPFTPNGDGINDSARIDFTIFKISTGREVRVRIYTLDGRLVWEESRLVHSGREGIPWAGVDTQGRLVPPGMYICQLELDVDSEEQGGTTRARLISVVY